MLLPVLLLCGFTDILLMPNSVVSIKYSFNTHF